MNSSALQKTASPSHMERCKEALRLIQEARSQASGGEEWDYFDRVLGHLEAHVNNGTDLPEYLRNPCEYNGVLNRGELGQALFIAVHLVVEGAERPRATVVFMDTIETKILVCADGAEVGVSAER